MQHRNGDLFTTDAKILAHGANTKGLMGAGIAKTVKETFPENYKGYRNYCKVGYARPGEWYANSQDDGRLLLNLFSQDEPGANARYEWVFDSLMDFLRFYSTVDVSHYGSVIAIPEIGSGIGGLEYSHVEGILQLIEDIHPEIEFEVWHYEPN